MTTLQNVSALRSGFKRFNRFMLMLWRLGLGPWVNLWPQVTGRIAVIAHVGRKIFLEFTWFIGDVTIKGG
jgi:hypothetical protein